MNKGILLLFIVLLFFGCTLPKQKVTIVGDWPDNNQTMQQKAPIPLSLIVDLRICKAEQHPLRIYYNQMYRNQIPIECLEKDWTDKNE